MRKVVVLSMMLLLWISAAKGQEEQRMTAEQVLAEMDSPTFVPTVKVSKVMHEGEGRQHTVYGDEQRVCIPTTYV